MPKHILHVVTNVAHYSDPAHPTGLWMSELTHAWEVFEARGFSLLETTASPDQIDAADVDAIYFTGGHAVMYDFTDSEGLQRITRELFDDGKVVSAVCHGYCGLLNTTLSNGEYLVAGRKMTGFSWREEKLARVDRLVLYNAEQLAVDRGARYEKAVLPFVSNVVVDGRLVTGQNPGSAKATAEAVAAVLS